MATASKEARFLQLEERPAYVQIRQLLGRYLQLIIPNAALIERAWVLSAFPSRHVLCRLSVGAVEVVIIVDDAEGSAWAMLNLWDEPGVEEAVDSLAEELGTPVEKYLATYGVGELLRVECDVSFATRLLDDPPVRAAAAHLVGLLMPTGGMSIHQRGHNEPFAADVLRFSREGRGRVEAALTELGAEAEPIGRLGAGFGDPEQNRVVDAAAQEAVTRHFQGQGWHVEDVSADKIAWDLTCTGPDGRMLKVEVKGVAGERPIVFLTPNEVRHAESEADWLLVVVTRALDDPLLREYSSETVQACLQPFAYRADLTGAAE